MSPARKEEAYSTMRKIHKEIVTTEENSTEDLINRDFLTMRYSKPENFSTTYFPEKRVIK